MLLEDKLDRKYGYYIIIYYIFDIVYYVNS